MLDGMIVMLEWCVDNWDIKQKVKNIFKIIIFCIINNHVLSYCCEVQNSIYGQTISTDSCTILVF